MSRRPFLLALIVPAVACSSAAPPAAAPAPMAAPMAAPTSTAAPAPTPAPAKPAALDPVGAFSAATEVNGAPISGKLTIVKTATGYGGRFVSDAFPEMPVSKVIVNGQTLTVDLETPNGTASVTMVFTGSDYTGQWDLGGQSGSMKGKRLP